MRRPERPLSPRHQTRAQAATVLRDKAAREPHARPVRSCPSSGSVFPEPFSLTGRRERGNGAGRRRAGCRDPDPPRTEVGLGRPSGGFSRRPLAEFG